MILIICLSVLYLGLLTYIAWSYRDNSNNIEELENRVLQLEKRIEETRKDVSNRCNNLYTTIMEIEEEIKTLEKRKCRCKREV